MTGHGTFGEFLKRIAVYETPAYQHCENPVDSAEHTLTEYKEELIRKVGVPLNLSILIGEMVRNKNSAKAMESFAEVVLSAKVQARREREEEARRQVGNTNNFP